MLQAVLWDMDGLLVDAEPLWTVAEHVLARSLGASSRPRQGRDGGSSNLGGK
jgi:beta-phosphoglucomutase-like phosphatase (HAD superfamily)